MPGPGGREQEVAQELKSWRQQAWNGHRKTASKVKLRKDVRVPAGSTPHEGGQEGGGPE